MATLALELHDAGLVAIRDPAEMRPLVDEPGYALLRGGEVLTGTAALRASRLEPRAVHHRFWQELDTAPLPRPFPQDRSAADLAHAQLRTVWERVAVDIDGVLLALPGTFDERQLGLVLGIASAAGLPVAGLVAAPVAAAATLSAAAPAVLHLDLHLHRAVLSELILETGPAGAPADATWIRGRIEVDDHFGLAAVQGALVRRLAQLFVQATRFDPLHSARSEQQLFDRLPEWLAAFDGDARLPLELEAGGQRSSVTVEVGRRDLLPAVEGFWGRLAGRIAARRPAGGELEVLVAARPAALPGLLRHLRALDGVRATPLPVTAAAAGALEHREAIRVDGEVKPFVIRLPAKAVAAASATDPSTEASTEPSRPAATHVVYDGLAHRLTEAPFALGTAAPEEGGRGLRLSGRTAGISRRHCRLRRRDDRVVIEDLGTWGSFVNDRRVDGEAILAAGDRLRLGSPGIELLLIRVTD